MCSIVYYYESEKKINEEPVINEMDVPLFLKYCTTPLTLFKLAGENTPFKEMSEKFQYIIINRY